MIYDPAGKRFIVFGGWLILNVKTMALAPVGSTLVDTGITGGPEFSANAATKMTAWRSALDTKRNRIAPHLEDNRDLRRCRLCCKRDFGATGGHDHCRRATREILCKRRQLIVAAFPPAKFDFDVTPLGIADLREAFTKGCETAAVAFRRFRTEIADHGYLLSAGRHDQCRRRRGDGDRRPDVGRGG